MFASDGSREPGCGKMPRRLHAGKNFISSVASRCSRGREVYRSDFCWRHGRTGVGQDVGLSDLGSPGAALDTSEANVDEAVPYAISWSIRSTPEAQ